MTFLLLEFTLSDLHGRIIKIVLSPHWSFLHVDINKHLDEWFPAINKDLIDSIRLWKVGPVNAIPWTIVGVILLLESSQSTIYNTWPQIWWRSNGLILYCPKACSGPGYVACKNKIVRCVNHRDLASSNQWDSQSLLVVLPISLSKGLQKLPFFLREPDGDVQDTAIGRLN